MKEHISLNNEEAQVLLWVRCYPGITTRDIKEKHLDIDISDHLKESLGSLVRKGYIKGDRDGWSCVKEIELPV